MHFTLFDFAISLLKNKNEPAVKRIFLLSQERAFFLNTHTRGQSLFQIG